MIKVMGAVIALLIVLSGFMGFRLQSTAHSLESLQTQYRQLQKDYDLCIEDKENIKEMRQIASTFLVNQREQMFAVKDEGQTDVISLMTFKQPKCPNNTANTGNIINEVDIDAPLDPEFIRLSEGSD